MNDMRSYLDTLVENNDLFAFGFDDPNGCEPEHHIASRIRTTCDMDGPALLFNTAKYPYAKTTVGGLYAAKRRVLDILHNGDEDYVLSEIDAVKRFDSASSITQKDRLKDYCYPIVLNPECQEVIYKRNVNLFNLPICTHNKCDNGPFITAGVNVVKWLDGKTHGLGIHRMNVIDHNHLSCLAPPNRRIGLPHYESSKNGKGIEMAVVIGAPPAMVLASQAKIPSDCEKYIVMAKLLKDHLSLVKCKTIDILVPANAEIILECVSVPNSSHDDTPFAEYPGTYSFRTNAWVAEVTAITTRKNPIYQTILTGKIPQEDSNLCAIPMAAEIYRAASRLAEVTDISVFLGNCVFDTIVCIKKLSNEIVSNLLLTLLGNKYIKSVTIMDDDLKANISDWQFAFNTRYQPNRDTMITGNTLGASLDPSSPLFQSTSKVGFDFTVPIGKTDDETLRQKRRHAVASTMYDYSILPTSSKIESPEQLHDLLSQQ